MNPNSLIQTLMQYFSPKVNTPIPIDQYKGTNAQPALPKATPAKPLSGENEWVDMMLKSDSSHNAQELHSLYKKAVTAPGGHTYQPGTKQQASPTPTPTPPAGPTPTPFPENPLNGYVMGTPKEYMPVIDEASKTTGMPTALLSGLLARESMRWNPDVISGNMNSPVGAQGIGQFMPATAKGLGIKNPLDPNEAIPAAAKYYMSHYHKYGRPDYALAAYNAGGAAVNQYGGIPPYKETQDYVRGILNDANQTFGGR